MKPKAQPKAKPKAQPKAKPKAQPKAKPKAQPKAKPGLWKPIKKIAKPPSDPPSQAVRLWGDLETWDAVLEKCAIPTGYQCLACSPPWPFTSKSGKMTKLWNHLDSYAGRGR